MDNMTTLRNALVASDLKFMETDNLFGLAFKGEECESVFVGVKADNDLVTLFSPVDGFSSSQEEVIVHNYLRLTFEADIYKLIQQHDGKYYLAAEIPSSLLDASRLKACVLGMVTLVDATPEHMLSLEHLRKKSVLAKLASLVGSQGHQEGMERLLPTLLRAEGLQPEPVGDGKYRFQIQAVGDIKLKLIAMCQPQVVSLICYSGVKSDGRGLAFYRKLAEANQVMDICKVALDKDEDVCFLYETAGADATSVKRAIERLKLYLPTQTLNLMGMEQGAALAAAAAIASRAGGAGISAPTIVHQQSAAATGQTASTNSGCMSSVLAIIGLATLVAAMASGMS